MTTTFLTSKFSLTENYLVSSIQNLKERRPTDSEANHFFRSEVMTRAIGVATSVFAAIDLIYHLGNTVLKISTYILYNFNLLSATTAPTTNEVLEGIALVATFAAATLTGSIVATIYPGICCYSSATKKSSDVTPIETDDQSEFSNTVSTPTDDQEEAFDYQAFGMTEAEYQLALKIQESLDLAQSNFNKANTPVDFAVDTTETTFGLPTTWEESAAKVQELWSKATNKAAFGNTWNSSSLEAKREFVHILDADKSAAGMAAKTSLVDTIYKHGRDSSYSYYKTPITSWPEQNAAAFYHATKLGGLEGILKSGKVEVRHQGVFKGAFVSTKPEIGPLSFGNYVFVFKRNIEWMSKLQHKNFTYAYWAGFKKDIPINKDTLEKIIVSKPSEMYLQHEDKNILANLDALKAKVKSWAGREINVEYYNPNNFLNMNHIVARDWDKTVTH